MTNLVELLPYSLKQDDFFLAYTTAFEQQLKELYEEFYITCALLVHLNNAPADLVDFLAFEKHVDFYENLTLEEKRRFVANSIPLHRVKGTPAAIERVFKLLNIDGRLKEWFEYDGDPYHFRLSLDVSERGITDELFNTFERLIRIYKNARSHIEIINVYLSSYSNLTFGATNLSGEAITVYPWSTTTIQTSGKYYNAISSSTDRDVTTIYPLVEEG